MPKYKSTAAYRATNAANKQIKAVYGTFGPDSELYEMYVNKLTASLPAGSVHVSKGGFIQISKGANMPTAAQIKKARKGLTSVKQAKATYKRDIAEEKLYVSGKKVTEVDIQREAKSVSDEEVKSYVDAKSYVRSQEDSRGKLRYDASVTDLMATAGAKSYELLRAILEEGETRANAEAQKESTNTAAVEGSYKNGGADIDSKRAKV